MVKNEQNWAETPIFYYFCNNIYHKLAIARPNVIELLIFKRKMFQPTLYIYKIVSKGLPGTLKSAEARQNFKI